MTTVETAAQVISISVALTAGGGMAAISLFDVPEWQSLPASMSLPSVRWLFSRGSHYFPPAAVVSTAGFMYLAYRALPAESGAIQLFRLADQNSTVFGYLCAAVASISIYPWTRFAMVPTNFELMELNEKKGGARSELSSKQRVRGSGRDEAVSAVESRYGKNQAAEFTDLSKPQHETLERVSESENKRVAKLLNDFAILNAVRAAAITVGGIVGLTTALSQHRS